MFRTARKTTRQHLSTIVSAAIIVTGMGAYSYGWQHEQANAATSDHGTNATRDIPKFVVRPCETQYSVNCRNENVTHGKADPFIVRQFPGTLPNGGHLTCVMYVHKPARDYCA